MSHPPLKQQPSGAPGQPDADALDFQHFMAGQNPVDAAAAGWLVRRQDGLDAEAEAEFLAWLAASPAHAPALDQLERLMGRVERLPRESVALLQAGLSDADHMHRPAAPDCARAVRPPWWRRMAPSMATVALLCVAVVSGAWSWDRWYNQPTFSQTFITARGEQRQIDLPDGSHVWLDTETRADIALYRSRREVRLPQGQAHFAVHADPGQPFDVLSGALRITVVGTRFTVRNTPYGLRSDGVGVVVEEGKVRVTPLHDAQQAVLLTAGQTVNVDAGGHLGEVALTAASTAKDAGAWREGRVNFAGVTLAQAVAEFERYGDTGLLLRDPRVAALRVRGSFDLHRVDAFASALPQVLPVRLRPATGGKAEIVGAAEH